MRRKAVLGALLLIVIGVLGATLFRSNIASATGLTHGVAAASSDGTPIKSKSSTPNSRVLTLEYFNGPDDEHFAPIRANLITLQGDTFGSNVAWVYLYSASQLVMFFILQPSERVVLPLPKAVKIDEIDFSACYGSIQCFVNANLIGS